MMSSQSLLRHWAVSTEDVNSEAPRIVFTLIGSAASKKLPILILSYASESWNAMLTCGEQLEGHSARLLMSWDGRNETVTWNMTPDHGATFTTHPEPFIMRLLSSHTLAVQFPLHGEVRRAVFDLTGLEKEIDKFPQAKKALAPKRREPARARLRQRHRLGPGDQEISQTGLDAHNHSERSEIKLLTDVERNPQQRNN